MRPPRVLFISGSAGLGHITRDLAIATELRAHWPGLELFWLAADPARLVLQHAGEPLTPECEQFAGETGPLEQLAQGFRLPLTDPLTVFRRPVWLLRTVLSLHREQRRNFGLFLQLVEREQFDLTVADEAYDLMLALARHPEKKPSRLAMIYDFVGLEPTSKSPLESLWVHVLNCWAIRLAKRIPLFCDRTLFVGEEEDVADKPFGLFLPNRRRWAARVLTYLGYVLPFHPADFQDPAAVRPRLGYGPEPLVICAIGGTRIGKALLELCGRAYPILRDRLPALRMIAVAGPRLDPETLDLPSGVERRGYVHRLYEHLAAADLTIVQGGGTTTLELTALRRPFIYFPLEGHFEQRFHVAGRIERHQAGLRMEYRETTPAGLAAAALSLIGKPVKYPPIPVDGATKAARVLSELLEQRESCRSCGPA
jgi:predicted glycosyltransferase